MSKTVAIAGGGWRAQIDPLGAELVRLQDEAGQDWLHDGQSHWSGRAPILFPVVGRVRDDHYRLDGQSWPMPKHGFARISSFEVVEAAGDRAVFRLVDSAATRAHYPFAFALEMAFACRDDGALEMRATVTNRDKRAMPASFGFHPAFRWPLPGGGARGLHRLVFASDEPSRVAAITADGLIAAATLPGPVEGRVLPLHDALFTHDALVWTAPVSRALRYEGADGRGLAVSFETLPMLGVWTRPGAPFLCIEPWAGIADPEGFAGELTDKPGMWMLAPGESRTLAMTVARD